MYLTGFADEAAPDIAGQIAATQALGWNAIESRAIDGVNIHDLPEARFDAVAGALEDAGVHVNCFGSAIANWGKSVEDPFEITLKEVDRAIPRMQRLGVKLIRIMSYARLEGDDQKAEERFRRLREITARFLDAGVIPVHENCMNYGGMSAAHSLKLAENVPGMKLAFDTGNPAISKDHSKQGDATQDSIEFLRAIRPHVAYVHIKDARLEGGREVYSYPGEGGGRVPDVVRELLATGYDGGISIEPHMSAVFHDPDAGQATAEESYAIYLEYGRRMQAMLAAAGAEVRSYDPSAD